MATRDHESPKIVVFQPTVAGRASTGAVSWQWSVGAIKSRPRPAASSGPPTGWSRLSRRDEIDGRSLLDETAREGARRMLVAAAETEVAASDTTPIGTVQ